MQEEWPGERSETRRRVGVEARAWGIQAALTNAFAGPLLVARGADVTTLGIFNAGISLFGLATALLGPLLARRTGGVARPALAALTLGRLAFLVAALLVVFTPSGALAAISAALILWSAGEGIALPLWKTYVAGLVRPAERRQWIAWQGAAAAAAVVAALPPLAVLALILPQRAWQIAFVSAAVAGIVSLDRLRKLFASTPDPPVPAQAPLRWRGSGGEGQFLVAIFCFWFGASLNRPILPRYLVTSLGATPAYFATAAAVTAIAGVLAQRLWGSIATGRRTGAVLVWSGVGAGLVPLLWMAVPFAWVGLPVEALAAGCWLGHLLGVAIRVAELAEEDAERPSLLARVHLMQGCAATIAPLSAAAIVSHAGAGPVLTASGLICLCATAFLDEREAPAWVARLGASGWAWPLRRGA